MNKKSLFKENGFQLLMLAVISLYVLLQSSPASATFSSSKDKLVGYWVTSRTHYNFKFASVIEVLLWKNSKQELSGLAVFHKGGQRCTGFLTLQSELNKLVFKTIDGKACEGLDNGFFVLLSFRNTYFQLTWFPSGIEGKSSMMLVNTASYKKPRKPAPEYLTELAEKFKTDQPPEKIIASLSSGQSKRIEQIKSRFKDDYDTRFSEAELIGVWKGTMHDRVDDYPLEIAFWPSSIYRLHHIAGIFDFDGKQCTTGAVVMNQKEEVSLHANPVYLTSSVAGCIPVTGSAVIGLSASKDEMVMYFENRYASLSGAKGRRCFDGLKREGCYTLGVFKRAKASDALNKEMSLLAWDQITPPQKSAWQYLGKNGKASDAIKSSYLQLASANAALLEKYKKEAEEAKKARVKKEDDKYWKVRARADQKNASPDDAAKQLEISKQTLSHLSGPFSNIEGGDYLNAIYEGSVDMVRHADRVYFEGLQPAIQDTMKMIKTMAPLLKWASGGLMDEEFLERQIEQDIKKLSAYKHVLATYLFNYQRTSGRCLRDPHEKFTVYRTTPDVIYKNQLGWEVGRIYGSSSEDTYLINQEFAEAFWNVGNAKQLGAAGKWVDSLYNQGKITSLISGTKKVMDEFSCDSEEIKRLEENLLRLYAQLQ